MNSKWSACPTAIPEAIEVDVTALDIGDVLHVEDLALPAGVEVPHDVNFTVITVTGHKARKKRLPRKPTRKRPE